MKYYAICRFPCNTKYSPIWFFPSNTRNTRLHDFFPSDTRNTAYTICSKEQTKYSSIRRYPSNTRNTPLYDFFQASHEILIYAIFLQTTHEILSYTAHEMAIRRFPCNTRNTRNTRLYDFFDFLIFLSSGKKTAGNDSAVCCFPKQQTDQSTIFTNKWCRY